MTIDESFYGRRAETKMDIGWIERGFLLQGTKEHAERKREREKDKER